MENRVVQDPPSKLNGKFHYFLYFLKPPLRDDLKYKKNPFQTTGKRSLPSPKLGFCILL